MKRNEIIAAIGYCEDAGYKVLTSSMALTQIKAHIEKMSDAREYSMSRYYHKDVENGIRIEELEENEKRLAFKFMYAMFDLNKSYRKKTGKFLFEKLEATYETAEMLYDMLQACL